jgi:Fic family protein
VAIEDNKLHLGRAGTLNDHLESFLPNLTSMTTHELSHTSLPDVRPLCPHADASQLAELRNHIIASHWVTEAALRNPGTAGIAEDEIRCLSAVLLKDTRSEVIYKHAWGKRVLLGDYRSTPIGVKSNPLRIFPYHDEVPACMRRFTQWRDKVTRERRLHPLIAACQMTAYFLHIHPFLDGNGRVSRLLMQDYMVRHGYVPVVIQGLDRRRYIDMISRAQDGKPDDFVTTILRTELEELKTLELRKMTTKHGVS